MSEEIEITVEIDKDLGYHENLKGRNELNQHPISSIIDLQETLTTLDDNIAKVNDKADSLKEELKLIEITGTPVDYDILINKPQINNIELIGNKTLEELNIQPAGDYVVNETLTEYAKTENIPTLVSQLENDTGYLVESSLDNYATKEEIPTLTSQLTNDSNFLSSVPEEYITEQELTETLDTTSESINQQINTKADKATTIAGYGITDAYTKTEIDEALNDKANSSSLSIVATSGSYTDLTNKPNIITSYNELLETPQIEGVDLKGNKSLTDLGIQPAGDYLTSVPEEYITETELNSKGYAQAADIPTNTSDLTNDSGYISETELSSKGYAQAADIPTNVSELTNDSGFITKEVSNLTNYTPTSELSAVATSGSYNDLTNKPTIPQEYTLPTASETTLGGVKIDNETITIQDGIISATTAASYTLPQASTETLGGVKIDGETITINEEGVISSQGGTTSDPLTINSLNVGTITGTGSTTLNQETLSNVLSLDGDGLIFGDAKAYLEGTITEADSFSGAWVLKDKFGVFCKYANLDDTMTNGTHRFSCLDADGPSFYYTGAIMSEENDEISAQIQLNAQGIRLSRSEYSSNASQFVLELGSHGSDGQITIGAASSTMGVAVSLKASYTEGFTLSFYREGVIDEEYEVLTSQAVINTLPETAGNNEQNQIPTVQLLRNTIGDIGSVLDSINGETV